MDEIDDYEGADGVEYEPQAEYDGFSFEDKLLESTGALEDGISGALSRFGGGRLGTGASARKMDVTPASKPRAQSVGAQKRSSHRLEEEHGTPQAIASVPEPTSRPKADRVPVSHAQSLSTLALSRVSTAKSVPPAPVPVKNVPSYVVSTQATHRRETADLNAGYAKLERAHADLQGKLAEASKRIKDLQREADVAQKDKLNALRRAEALEVKVAELEVEKLRGSAKGGNFVSASADPGKVASLEKRLQEVTHHKDVALDTLRKESKALEEARSYITVLLNAMETKGQLPTGEQNGALLAELRRLRGEVESRSRDSTIREVASVKLEEQLRDLQARHSRLTERFHDLQQGGGTTARVAQLESEREALMEYLQERKSDINKLNDSVALLSADKGELEAEVSRLRSALESETADRQAAGVTVESLRLQLSHVSSELARVQTSEKTLSEQQVALNAALETQARELEDAAAIQVELLNTVREHKHAADDALAHGHALEVELGSVKAALARTQATLGAREDEAGRTTADLASVTGQLGATQESLNRLQADFRQALHEKDGLARQVSVLEQELRTTSQRLDEATAARVTLETKIATLDAKLSAANLELTSLRLIKEAVDAAESKLAAVSVKEDVAEREEEREMGQKRMYRPSVRQSPRVASEIGEGKAEGDLYEFDVAFQFDSGSSGDADDTSVLVATAAAQIAQTRADRSIEWATSTEIAGLVPNMSTAARRLASWLRAAGVALADTAKLLATEKRDKRTQRRLLHDEIHALRQEADSLHSALKEDRAKLTDAEASANYATRQRESDVTQLRSSLHDAEGRATRAEASVKELSSQLVDNERRLEEALSELSATSARLSEVRVENETLRVTVGNVESEVSSLLDEKKFLTTSLATASAQCDSLKVSLDSRERELQDTVRHTDVEKRVLLEKIRSLESKDGTTTTRVSELSTELDNLRTSLAVAESENRHLKAQLEQLQARKTLMEEQSLRTNAETEDLLTQMKTEMDTAQHELMRQSDENKALSRSKAELEETVAVLQRSVVSLTQDAESARTALQSGFEDAKRRIHTSSKISGLLAGVEEFLEEVSQRDAEPSPSWYKDSGRQPTRRSLSASFPQLPLKRVAELNVELSRRLTDNVVELLHRLASTSAEADRLKSTLESSRPHIEALETASTNAYERAQALVSAESRVAELRAELAARTSQLDIATGEVDSLRRQVMDLQLQSERSASQLAKLANEVDLTRASSQRLAGQLEDTERRRRELDAELSRLRGNRDYDVAERRRVEAEVSRDQEKQQAIMSELESLKTGRARLEASVAEYRAALSTAKQDHANAIAEITALTKQLLVAENRVSSKDAEIQDLHRQVGELRQAKVDLERRLTMEASHSSADQQEALRARNEAVAKLAKAQTELAEAKSEVRRQADLCRVTQTSLEECRMLLAQTREEKSALLARVGEPLTFSTRLGSFRGTAGLPDVSSFALTKFSPTRDASRAEPADLQPAPRLTEPVRVDVAHPKTIVVSTPSQRPITPSGYVDSGDDTSSVGGVSTRSGTTPSPGAARLQERLRKVQETFAQLRAQASV